MKNILFAALMVIFGSLTNFAKADFAGSTYTMTGAFSLCVTNASVTINNVVPASYNVSTLIFSNSAAGPISIRWAAPGHAVGAGSTNLFSLAGGQVAQININAVFPGLVIYSTQVEQGAPVTNSTPSLIPELLYYKLTEGALAYQNNAGYFENAPVYLTDSSVHGGSTGTITTTGVPVQWVPNQNGTLVSAVHFNGASTTLDAGNSSIFNFTTNLFSINLWVRNLTYPCALCGNGIYLNSGWYVVVNPAGEIVAAAENPGSDSYVATTSTVAFTGQWCMITVVRTDAKTVLIYRNTLLQNTLGSFTNPAPCNNDLLFGNNYYGNVYDGDLGTIRIYSHPLTTNEINSIYLNDTSAP